jgi:hypothetical protein
MSASEKAAFPGRYRLCHFHNAGIIVRIGPMRNPDEWPSMEPDDPDIPRPLGSGDAEGPRSRRGALVGLVLILLLVAGGLLLTHVLHGMSQLQDCALSGRSNCS